MKLNKKWLIGGAIIAVMALLLVLKSLRGESRTEVEVVLASEQDIRPSILAPFATLLLGLFLDLFWGGPLGLWGLSLLVAYAMVLTARNMMTGQSRPMMWAWFAGVTAVTMIAGFLFSMLDSLAMPSLLAVFWQFLATALLFPFAHRLVDRFDDADVRFR